MKFVYGLIIFVSFLYPSFISAEYYRYTGRDGIVHFTDNLADVPMEQRKKANTYKEEVSESTHDETTIDNSETPQEKTNRQIPGSKENDTVAESKTLSQIQRLNREKEILDKNYELLVTKKQALKREKVSITTSEQVKVYKNKVKNLNQKISDFEISRQVFEKKAKEFNARPAQ